MKKQILSCLFYLLAEPGFTQITFDYSAAELVIDYFLDDKEENIVKIINHPGYIHVFEHSKKYSSSPLDQKLLESSLLGQSNAFNYNDIDKRLDTLRQIITYLKANEQLMKEEFAKLPLKYLPGDYKQKAKVFFIIGGYNGIAMDGKVSINIDWQQFRNDKQEIFLYLSHELFHIGFEQYHATPDVFAIKTAADLKRLVMYFTMNEGLATLVPWQYRTVINALEDYDYTVLTDTTLLAQKLQQFSKLMKELNSNNDSAVTNKMLNNTLSECSGDRLFYIAGCYMGARIEKKYDRNTLIGIIKKSPEEFFDAFNKIK